MACAISKRGRRRLRRAAAPEIEFKKSPLPQPEPTAKDDFRDGHHEEHRAHDRIETKKSNVDPVQTATAGDPMFEQKTSKNQQPAHNVSNRAHAKSQESEREQQSTHEHVGQE